MAKFDFRVLRLVYLASDGQWHVERDNETTPEGVPPLYEVLAKRGIEGYRIVSVIPPTGGIPSGGQAAPAWGPDAAAALADRLNAAGDPVVILERERSPGG